jgi:hypothetical protein
VKSANAILRTGAPAGARSSMSIRNSRCRGRSRYRSVAHRPKLPAKGLLAHLRRERKFYVPTT